MARVNGPVVNPDVDDIADWSKWGYAVGTRLIAAAQQHLAMLAGTGRLDPDEAMFLQEGLEGIYDALYMGTVSAVRGPDDDLEDDNTYSDGRRVALRLTKEFINEAVTGWKHSQFLLRDGANFVYPPGTMSHISPPKTGTSLTAFCESDFLKRFYKEQRRQR